MQQKILRWRVGVGARERQFMEMSFPYYWCYRWVSTLHKQNNYKTNICSVYDDQTLHGFQRGANAFFAEPLESWLSVMSNAVPFIHDCLVVAPSTISSERLRALLHRAQAHFPQVHVAQLRKTINGINFQKQCYKSQLTSSQATCTTCLSPPVHLFASPLEEITEKSLDVIVFADNVFGNEMLFDSPWHISLAAKALRPHGVLALFGYSSEMEISNPTWAKQNVMDYLKAHRQNVLAAIAEGEKMEFKQYTENIIATTTETAKRRRAHCVPYLTDNVVCANKDKSAFCRQEDKLDKDEEKLTDTRQKSLISALRCAWEAECSINTGHADTYLPSLAVRRAWFVSEYALSHYSLIDYLRSSHTYKLVHKLQNGFSEINRDEEQCSKNGADHFVDVEEEVHDSENYSMPSIIHKSSTDNNENNLENTTKCYANDNDAPVFIRRRANEVDHLEALFYCLHDHLHASEREDLLRCQGRHQEEHQYLLTNTKQTRSAFPPLRARIRHFTVTCSNRSMNSIDKFNKFVKLPGATCPYLPNS